MSEREEIRNAALEDAAHLCDKMAGEMFNDSKTFHFCAEQIRKLKTDLVPSTKADAAEVKPL